MFKEAILGALGTIKLSEDCTALLKSDAWDMATR
jgi:hypothetical protein